MRLFNPTKIVCVGLNYFDHAKELKMPIPEHPLIFLKPATAVIENNEPIIYPAQTRELHYEAELGVVIKDRIKNIPAADVSRHILGYTCANDVTARDLQRIDGQWTRAKSFDTFCPLGPQIVPNLDPTNLKIFCRVNGQLRQSSNTQNMIFNVFKLVAFISSVMTLLPGDVLITGTPPGVGALEVGDEVEVEIETLGILKNKVIAGYPE